MAARKGQFKKGGGRVGGGAKHRKSHRTSGGSTAIVVVPAAKSPTHKRRSGGMVHHKAKHKAKRHHRRGGGHGGVTVAKIAGTALVLANVVGKNDGLLGSTVYDWVQKIPGTKTLGPVATTGLVAGGLHRFTRIGGRFRPWLAAAGVVGVVAAFMKLGEVGSNIKWLGGYDRSSAFDVG